MYVQVAEHGLFGCTVCSAGLPLFSAYKWFVCQKAAAGQERGEEQTDVQLPETANADFPHVNFSCYPDVVAAYCVTTAGLMLPPALCWNRPARYVTMVALICEQMLAGQRRKY